MHPPFGKEPAHGPHKDQSADDHTPALFSGPEFDSPERAGRFVEVVIFSGPGQPFTYDAGNFPGVMVGSLVVVSLGRRQEKGIVVRLLSSTRWPPQRLRPLIAAVHAEPVLDEKLVKLALWISDYYACPLPIVIESMVPAPIRSGAAEVTDRWVGLAGPVDDLQIETVSRRAPRQAEVLRFLRQQAGPVKRSLLATRFKLSDAVIVGLVSKGLVVETRVARTRSAYGDGLDEEGMEAVAALPPELTADQELCVAALRNTIRERVGQTVLLHGVTGSGKTEVYLRAMEEVLAGGGGVLFLVPEIALAPQTVARVRGRFSRRGEPVVVWHSHLSAGERADAFRTLQRGEARVVVGARSAVFAPVRDLRLIIVDEEHEGAYKQEESPRYHGRDLAVVRALQAGAVCLLGTATPSVESVANVRAGKYQQLVLPRRIDGCELPLVHLVDLRRIADVGEGGLMFSPLLREKMLQRLENKEQIILFLNRRGYSTSAACKSCGKVMHCPHCAVPMTLHKGDGKVKCHLCGYEDHVPHLCPACGAADFVWRGTGTQKVEAAVRAFAPHARVARLDADAMGRKNLFRKVLADFRCGRIDILVGTQMLAKGLDFPNVTLVGLVDADQSLNQEDFRAGERTFQLIVQVSGRSGRGQRAGEVVIQSFQPHAAPIQFARHMDFDGFYEEELQLRKEFAYPPFRHLVRQVVAAPQEEKAFWVAEAWIKEAAKRLAPSVEVRGPAIAPIEKMQDLYRVQVWYFTPHTRLVSRVLSAMASEFPAPPGVRITFDVDALSVR